MATGYASKVKGSNDGEDKDPTDGELRILVNSVKWLAKETR
jgi:hypothetical protein